VIPVNEPLLDGNELDYVSECITTSWISSSGSFLDRFENSWAKYCGMKHGIAVCNGTVALDIAVASFDFSRGSEIILPSFTIISCTQAVIRNGCVPVLVDCLPDTWCLNPSQVAERVTEKTVALMPVHMYGHPADMEEILGIAEKHRLKVIEDAAESHGAEVLLERTSNKPVWKRCGGIGDASCFSFYANKIITTGEGGMVLTNSDEHAQRLRKHRNLYFGDEQKFLHHRLGGNYRLTNLQAAVGCAQLDRIEQFLARKRQMARRYTEQLSDLPLVLPTEKNWAKNVYWMYGIVLKDEISMHAGEFSRLLKNRGVQTRPFFLGMHEQPVFHRMGLFLNEHYPVCERISRRGLYLPSGQAITDRQIDKVCSVIKELLGS
jgi:perosamine synthetase